LLPQHKYPGQTAGVVLQKNDKFLGGKKFEEDFDIIAELEYLVG
jgi:hypothetical protein